MSKKSLKEHMEQFIEDQKEAYKLIPEALKQTHKKYFQPLGELTFELLKSGQPVTKQTLMSTLDDRISNPHQNAEDLVWKMVRDWIDDQL